MKTVFQAAALALLLFGTAACEGKTATQTVAPAAAPTADEGKGFAATVTAVSDGDTVRATDRNGRKLKIRMAYIDAPESDQAHGKASRDALNDMVMRKNVRVEVFDTDQYGRQVARLYLDGQDVNLAQIRNGHAWHYRSIARKNQNKADYAVYEAAEREAKDGGAGLWRQRNPQAPWAFRRQKRGENPSE